MTVKRGWKLTFTVFADRNESTGSPFFFLPGFFFYFYFSHGPSYFVSTEPPTQIISTLQFYENISVERIRAKTDPPSLHRPSSNNVTNAPIKLAPVVLSFQRAYCRAYGTKKKEREKAEKLNCFEMSVSGIRRYPKPGFARIIAVIKIVSSKLIV